MRSARLAPQLGVESSMPSTPCSGVSSRFSVERERASRKSAGIRRRSLPSRACRSTDSAGIESDQEAPAERQRPPSYECSAVAGHHREAGIVAIRPMQLRSVRTSLPVICEEAASARRRRHLLYLSPDWRPAVWHRRRPGSCWSASDPACRWFRWGRRVPSSPCCPRSW